MTSAPAERTSQALAEALRGWRPVAPGSVPTIDQTTGGYRLGFATTPGDLEDILRLRFRVFNLELGEGLDESYTTGLDQDPYDRAMHHLLVRAVDSGEVVGTYRLQTGAMARAAAGYYTDEEFDLGAMPAEVLENAVEIGRACVAGGHRNGRVLHLLWRGLAKHLAWNRKRYLFGCCSLTSQDPALGVRVERFLHRHGYSHPDIRVPPRPAFVCRGDTLVGDREEHIPALFRSYLNLGARVCGPPAIDRRFGTIDFLVLLDTRQLDARIYQSFFG